MPIKIKTETPEDLLNKIIESIDIGEQKTWGYLFEDDAYSFIHTTKRRQWEKYYFVANADTENSILVFDLVHETGDGIEPSVSSALHGRLTEMLMDFTEETVVLYA